MDVPAKQQFLRAFAISHFPASRHKNYALRKLRALRWLLVVGCWLLVVGCWLLVVNHNNPQQPPMDQSIGEEVRRQAGGDRAVAEPTHQKFLVSPALMIMIMMCGVKLD